MKFLKAYLFNILVITVVCAIAASVAYSMILFPRTVGLLLILGFVALGTWIDSDEPTGLY